ncbi:GSCOCG00012834001-RA-CDS, partial [Cotesia congregata]
LKRNNWVESLRSGVVNDRYKKLEDGWDDTNIIKHPREKKWQITMNGGYTVDSIDGKIIESNSRRKSTSRLSLCSKNLKRNNNKRHYKSSGNVIEWEKLLEMASARKLAKNKRLFNNPLQAMSETCLLKDLTLLLEDKVSQHDQARSEKHLAEEQSWLASEHVWLLHRGGFTLATRSEASADPDTGKLRIKLVPGGEELLVDEEDVEKANPPQFDMVEELSQLRFLNESSVLHTLRQRYANNLIHTYAGDSMVVINPVAPLAIYSEKVVHMFKGCKNEDMPPHIYAMAQSAYRGMLATRRDHSLVFLGRSGAGKTTNFKHALHYLILAAGTVNKVFIYSFLLQ